MFEFFRRAKGVAAVESATTVVEAEAPVVEPFDASAFAKFLRERVVGQDGVCDGIAYVLHERLAGRRPVVLLFAGQDDSAKFECAKAIAEFLRRVFVFEDMSEFATLPSSTKLFGAPRGYVGSEHYGSLSGALKAAPDAVVLLEDIDKAHSSILTRLGYVWRDGYVVEASDSARVPSARAIWIVTTKAEWQKGFSSEALNGIGDIFDFVRAPDLARDVNARVKRYVESYWLKLVDDGAGIDAELLEQAVVRSGAQGIDEVARLIAKQIDDGLIEAKVARVKAVRISMTGPSFADIRVEPA